MNLYKEAYLKLYNTVTDAISALQQVQVECETVFMEDETQMPQLQIFPISEKSKKGG